MTREILGPNFNGVVWIVPDRFSTQPDPEHKMTKRLVNPAEFGFSEEEWAALSEERRMHFSNRAHYQRNKEKRQAYQREYYHRNKEQPDSKGT